MLLKRIQKYKVVYKIITNFYMGFRTKFCFQIYTPEVKKKLFNSKHT